MTLNQILYFQTVARVENYHRAAEELYISQPSLSRSIAALEAELGTRLFEKRGRGVVITKAGKLFLEYSDRILRECTIAVDKMQEISSDGGRLDIGYVFPLAGYYIPHMVRSFLDREENRHVAISFRQNYTGPIAELVRTGEVDVGFGGYLENGDMEFWPVLEEELVIITPADHRLNEMEDIPLAELNNYPVIGYDHASWMGKYTRLLYQKFDIHPDIVTESPDEYSMAALVSENFGIALVSWMDLLRHTNVKVHRIKGIQIVDQKFMFWMKDRYRMPAVERFIAYMKEQSAAPNNSNDASKLYLKDIVNY